MDRFRGCKTFGEFILGLAKIRRSNLVEKNVGRQNLSWDVLKK
jgi:hypothetical protein